MVSPLEIDQGVSTDSDDVLLAKRRTKNELEDSGQSSILGNLGNNVLVIPFMIILSVPQFLYQVVCQLVGDPLHTVREFFAVNRETDAMLNEIPEQQRQQAEHIKMVHEEQIHQREKLENLRRRIQKIEERRAAREKEHNPELLSSSSASRDKME